MHRYLKNLNKLKMSHLDLVGGKNASLGEMMNSLNRLDLNLPQGYALITEAYSDFIKENKIEPYIQNTLNNKDLSDIKELHFLWSINKRKNTFFKFTQFNYRSHNYCLGKSKPK